MNIYIYQSFIDSRA